MVINFELQNHKPLRELVYEELKRQILTGEIAPGHRMMEIELAESMGVSRTPIREAIRQLEKEGLVQIETRKGAYASEVSLKEMVDTLLVREELEGLAAGIAAKNITPEEKVLLANAADDYQKAVENGEIEEIVKDDELFHKIIVKASKNETLIQMVFQAQDMSLRFRYLYYDDFSRFENLPSEHKEILYAILSGDSTKARTEMVSHLSDLRKFITENEEKIIG